MIRVGHGSTLCGNAAGIVVPEASGAGMASRRGGRAATHAPIAGSEVVSLESSGSFGYDCGVNPDRWELSDGPLWTTGMGLAPSHYHVLDRRKPCAVDLIVLSC